MFGKKKQELYVSPYGQSMLRLPIGKKESVNVKKKQVAQLGPVSASELLYRTGFYDYNRVLYLGNFQDAVKFARRFQGEDGGTLITVKANLRENEFESVFSDYFEEFVPSELPIGNGILCLKLKDLNPLKRMLQEWDPHTFILLPGGGINLTEELFDCFYGHHLLIITEAIYDGLGKDCTAHDIFRRMHGIIIGGTGAVSEEIMKIMPKYDATTADTTMGIDFHPVPYPPESKKKKKKLKKHAGFNWNQEFRSQEKPVLSEGDLTYINRSHQVVCLDLHGTEKRVFVAGPITF